MNRTIKERIIRIFFDAKLPKSFLAKVMHIIIDLINLSFSALLDGDILKRVWTRNFFFLYKYLRVFGCRGYVQIPKDERSKLDDKTKKCIS